MIAGNAARYGWLLVAMAAMVYGVSEAVSVAAGVGYQGCGYP
jgi:membrane protein DedA with SNARE-associated domain